MSNTVVQKVSEAANISNEQATVAVDTIREILKEKLPYLLHQQIDILLAGGSVSDGFKQKFDSLKTDLEHSAKDLGEKAQELSSEIGKKINELFQNKK